MSGRLHDDGSYTTVRSLVAQFVNPGFLKFQFQLGVPGFCLLLVAKDALDIFSRELQFAYAEGLRGFFSVLVRHIFLLI